MTTRTTDEGIGRADAAEEGRGPEHRRDGRALGRRRAANPRWPKLGLAAILGLVAGATLFATEAKGRQAPRSRPTRRD